MGVNMFMTIFSQLSLRSRLAKFVVGLYVLFLALPFITEAQERRLPNLFAVGRNRTEAIKVTDAIYMAEGFGNTFMVITGEGNVIIDTSLSYNVKHHKRLLRAIDEGPIKYIILTHAHADHTGGVKAWKEKGTEIIAQENAVEFLHYKGRLASFFALRNEAQFGFSRDLNQPPLDNYGASIDTTILFDDKYEFELGGVKFEIYHTPGETYDHLSVWIPQYKAVFTGDNYYQSFPNIYTLRGTKPRWALDYVESLNKVLSWKPEILLPSHGLPIHGSKEVQEKLTQYRDAILYVHDATVKGMNEGKDVFTLMREIELPLELDIGSSYGKVGWSVRGIYEGYAGWFDGNPSSMYDMAVSAVYPDLVSMAGGANVLASRASELVVAGKVIEGLHLADIALWAEPKNEAALKVRLAALERLKRRVTNFNERGWLLYGIRTARARLAELGK
jgi:alkyl sulfatase BDS1-like metallo-beta-lactamase superfamily hydrolase